MYLIICDMFCVTIFGSRNRSMSVFYKTPFFKKRTKLDTKLIHRDSSIKVGEVCCLFSESTSRTGTRYPHSQNRRIR